MDKRRRQMQCSLNERPALQPLRSCLPVSPCEISPFPSCSFILSKCPSCCPHLLRKLPPGDVPLPPLLWLPGCHASSRTFSFFPGLPQPPFLRIRSRNPKDSASWFLAKASIMGVASQEDTLVLLPLWPPTLVRVRLQLMEEAELRPADPELVLFFKKSIFDVLSISNS